MLIPVAHKSVGKDVSCRLPPSANSACGALTTWHDVCCIDRFSSVCVYCRDGVHAVWIDDISAHQILVFVGVGLRNVEQLWLELKMTIAAWGRLRKLQMLS